jgi:hypothetical protein
MKAVSLMLKVFFSQEITAIEASNIIANMCKTGKCKHHITGAKEMHLCMYLLYNGDQLF